MRLNTNVYVSIQRESSLIAWDLVDFAVGLVNSVLNLHDKQMNFFTNSYYRKTVINPAYHNFFQVN